MSIPKNSYFKAMLAASAGMRLPNYADDWRLFHPRVSLQDQETKKYQNQGVIIKMRNLFLESVFLIAMVSLVSWGIYEVFIALYYFIIM